MKTAAMALLVAGLAFGQDEEGKKWAGKTPPELTADAKNWINAKKPLKLADLKGRVVWLEFSFLN